MSPEPPIDAQIACSRDGCTAQACCVPRLHVRVAGRRQTIHCLMGIPLCSTCCARFDPLDVVSKKSLRIMFEQRATGARVQIGTLRVSQCPMDDPDYLALGRATTN